jgi:3-oxoacyl-[acyl-carrier protein] reductase
MELNLRGRTALVTGASKGIGLASAECLAAEGVNVILVSRTQADLDTARQKIMSRCNVNVQVHAYDLSDSRNVDKLVAEHAGIDILVNNAGAIPAGDLQQITEDRWRQAWDLKVFGYINMCRRFYAEMKSRGRGVIINVLGVAGGEDGPHLYRRLDRQRRVDGVHKGSGWFGGRRQVASGRHQSRGDRD